MTPQGRKLDPRTCWVRRRAGGRRIWRQRGFSRRWVRRGRCRWERLAGRWGRGRVARMAAVGVDQLRGAEIIGAGRADRAGIVHHHDIVVARHEPPRAFRSDGDAAAGIERRLVPRPGSAAAGFGSDRSVDATGGFIGAGDGRAQPTWKSGASSARATAGAACARISIRKAAAERTSISRSLASIGRRAKDEITHALGLHRYWR